MLRKALPLLLVLALAANALVGCTAKPPVTVTPQEPKILNLVQVEQGATLNHHASHMAVDNAVIRWFVGTLYTYLPLPDRSGAVIAPELAASPPVNPSGDGKVWQISLSQNAKWENGDPITADDFIYSWKMLIDPIMVNTQSLNFARRFIEVENAVAYFEQGDSKTVSWESVGISKIDDYTIGLTLKETTATDIMRHLSGGMTGPVYEALYEEHMNADRTATRYGTSKETLMASGAFKLTEWVIGAERVMEKNPYYTHADKVKLDKVYHYVIENAGTRLQMFESGQLDLVSVPTADIPKYVDDPRLVMSSTRPIPAIELNPDHPDKPILKNNNFRKAIYYGVDRATIAKLTGNKPAPYIVSETSIAYSDGTSFRALASAAGYVPENDGYNPQLALEYFNTALKEEGLTKVEFTLNYANTIQGFSMVAEYIQESLPNIFGVDRFKLELNPGPAAQMNDIMQSSQSNPSAYEMSMSRWGQVATNYNPAYTFVIYTTSYNRRNANYNNDRIDALFAESQTPAVRQDEKRLAQLAMDMEKIYLDEVITVPVLQSVNVQLVSERLLLPLIENHVDAGFATRFADIHQ